jgi:membrane-bound lytic murein transglycosylase A
MDTQNLRLAAIPAALLALLVGCAAPQQAIQIPGEAPPAPVASRPSSSPQQAGVPSSSPVTQPQVPSQSPSQSSSAIAAAPPSIEGSTAGQAVTFSTQLANYTASSYDSVPGWNTDNFAESWPAFLESCKILTNRGAEWKDLCARARQVDGNNAATIRAFYEREFAAYQIRGDDRKTDGVVTGYFEPEINGSRRYGAPFIYPVYGQPEDMLYLDARKISSAQRGSTLAARVEGRNVVLQPNLSTKDMGAPGLFVVNMTALGFDTLDRKVRLRINGKQLQPYYTREEIETLGAPNAKVLAFVDSATALYEMQVQGSGRIRMREGGEILRVSYAEQNGHPFRPTLVSSNTGRPQVKTRGMNVELAEDDDGDDGAIRTRGFKLAAPVKSGAVALPGQKPTAQTTGSGIKDPSYVFFREAPVKTGGPLGAFGVPLSAGRSIAVDPRSTPLGYPVFVSTRNPTNGLPLRRLTIAQDTGGAIRGAVRADYFFGDGQQAATQARRMKESGQLWLLLPRGLKVAAASVLPGRTRGVGGANAVAPQCIVPSDDFCADDQ